MIPTTEAIVLKSFDYRETSRIVRFFTKSQGKLSVLFKGIRKDPKKFGSSVDKFTVNDLVYYHYRRTDLHLASQCDLKHFYFQIRQDYPKNMAAHYMTELVDTIMQPGETNQEVYALMIQFLDSLEKEADISRLVHIFQIKILQLSGFSPHLDADVRTGKPITGKARFSMKAGGLVSDDTAGEAGTLTPISKGTIATILNIEKSSWAHCLRIGLTATVRRELKYILNNFLVYHLERKIKSAQYL